MVGEYQVTGVLGEGGMGTVYSGVQPLIGKKVAIKVLKAELSRDPEVMERFLAEARAVNRIGHPNIIDVFSFGAFPDGAQYFVMEHLQGRSLSRRLLDRGPLPYGDALALLTPVCDALEAAHQRGIVHRDLKPDNIFLVERPEGFMVKLLDFGIAKFTDDSPMTGHTRTGVPMGTPLYMAPEQCRGRDIGPESDIYSLGVILFELFAGSPPFVAESFYEVITAHLTKEPPPLTAVSNVSPAVAAIVARCLAKEKSARYPSVRALRDELLPVLQRLADTHAGAPTAKGPPPVIGSLTSVGAAAPAPRRGRGWWLAGGAVAVLLAAVLGVALLRSRPTPGPTPPPAAAAPAASVDAAPRLVTIQLLVNPADARPEVWVDGQPHDRLVIETPPSRTRALEIKVVAPGYQPFVAQAKPVADLMLPINLVKLGELGRRPAGRTGAGGATGAPAPKAPAAPPRVDRVTDI
jgi:serine/threonine-protein kinase